MNVPDGHAEATWLDQAGRVIPGAWASAVDQPSRGDEFHDDDGQLSASPVGPLSCTTQTSSASENSDVSEDGDGWPRPIARADGSASRRQVPVGKKKNDAVIDGNASAPLQQWVAQGQTGDSVVKTDCDHSASETGATQQAPLRVDALERLAEEKARGEMETTAVLMASSVDPSTISVLESLQKALHAERDARDAAVQAGVAVARAEAFDDLKEMATSVATQSARTLFATLETRFAETAAANERATRENAERAARIAELALTTANAAQVEIEVMAAQIAMMKKSRLKTENELETALASACETCAALATKVSALEKTLHKGSLKPAAKVAAKVFREKKIKTVQFFEQTFDAADDTEETAVERSSNGKVLRENAEPVRRRTSVARGDSVKTPEPAAAAKETVTPVAVAHVAVTSVPVAPAPVAPAPVAQPVAVPISEVRERDMTEMTDHQPADNRQKWVTAKRTSGAKKRPDAVADTAIAGQKNEAQTQKVKRKHSLQNQYDGPECVLETAAAWSSESSYFAVFEDTRETRLGDEDSDDETNTESDRKEGLVGSRNKQAARRAARAKTKKSPSTTKTKTSVSLATVGSVQAAQREIELADNAKRKSENDRIHKKHQLGWNGALEVTGGAKKRGDQTAVSKPYPKPKPISNAVAFDNMGATALAFLEAV